MNQNTRLQYQHKLRNYRNLALTGFIGSLASLWVISMMISEFKLNGNLDHMFYVIGQHPLAQQGGKGFILASPIIFPLFLILFIGATIQYFKFRKRLANPR